MKMLITAILLTTVASTPLVADTSTSASLMGAMGASGMAGVTRAANLERDRTEANPYQATSDCCYDEVILDRPQSQSRPALGPDCCWDASNWD